MMQKDLFQDILLTQVEQLMLTNFFCFFYYYFSLYFQEGLCTCKVAKRKDVNPIRTGLFESV